MGVNPAAHLGQFITRVGAANAAGLAAAARLIHQSLIGGGLIHVAGAGHSLNAVTESFFRAGGLALVKPLWHPRIFPLHGAQASTAAEREAGLGAMVIAAAAPTSADVVFVFSNSGINHYPIEIAQGARQRGAPVVAVTSRAACAAAPLRAGARLADIADLVIDTLVPPGDVTFPPHAPVTAPLSSLANLTCWTLLLEQVVTLDPAVPLWRSANVAGTDQDNARTMAQLAGRVAEL